MLRTGGLLRQLTRRPCIWTRWYSDSSLPKDQPPPKTDPKQKPQQKDQKPVVDETGMFLHDRPNVPLHWRKMPNLKEWQRQMFALKEKYHNQGWKPGKKLSRQAMEGVRYLKAINPHWSAGDIAKHYEVSPEAIRRILKSKWRPDAKESQQIADRWQRRGERLGSKAIKKQESAEKQPESKPRRKRKKDIGDMYF